MNALQTAGANVSVIESRNHKRPIMPLRVIRPEIPMPAKPKLLCVDDSATQRRIYMQYLDRLYNVDTAADGQEALDKAHKTRPDLILLDIDMPKINGLLFLRMFRDRLRFRDIPVMMISSLNDPETVKAAFENGAKDYLRKPFFADELLMRVRLQIENAFLKRQSASRSEFLEHSVDEKIVEIKNVKNTTIFALAELAESRDNDTGDHLLRIREYVKILSDRLSRIPAYEREINREFRENIYHMSVLHDIGKVGIPDKILLKPGRLTSEEFDLMKTHARIGGRALDKVCKINRHSGFLKMGRDIAMYHHERWDGTGYSDGLKGTQIPLAARIVTLADIYDALSTKRVYKAAFNERDVMEIMAEENGKAFDPVIYDAFIDARESFKNIRLNNEKAPTPD